VLSRNLTHSMLAWNVRSALIQVSALRNTYVALGERYTATGIANMMKPGGWDFAHKRSRVLSGRDYEVAVTDITKVMRGTGLKQKVGIAGMKALQTTDIITATATWHGAYSYGKRALNYTERKAVNFADDTVTKTQASASRAHVSPVQMSDVGKALALFQTFVINEWNFLTHEVLGIKNPRISKKQKAGRALRFVIGTALFNMLIEDLMGLHSPFPRPVKALMESIQDNDTGLETVGKVAKESAEQIPLIGGAIRYQSSPGGAVLDATRRWLKDPTSPEATSKIVGLPGAAEISKAKRAYRRGEGPYGIITGANTKRKR